MSLQDYGIAYHEFKNSLRSEPKDEAVTVSLVEISFFKPEGFADRWLVRTDNRAQALRSVMAKYDDRHLAFFNYANVSAVSSKMVDPRLPEAEVVA